MKTIFAVFLIIAVPAFSQKDTVKAVTVKNYNDTLLVEIQRKIPIANGVFFYTSHMGYAVSSYKGYAKGIPAKDEKPISKVYDLFFQPLDDKTITSITPVKESK